MESINYASTNSNSHFMTKSSSFYYGEEMKHWANTPMSYALDIALENHFSEILKFPLDRIIYASNDYCFRERSRRNEGDLNLPFINYYRNGYDDSEREWFNDYSNRFGLIDCDNEFTSKLGGKLKIYPISISYEGSIFFSQNKDCEYAINQLLFDASNETIIYPELETNEGDIIRNIGIFNPSIEYMPNYKESDWLEQNRIWSIGLDFTVNTFMIGNFDTNPNNLHVAKSLLLQFFSAKKINYSDPSNSPRYELLLDEYFGN